MPESQTNSENKASVPTALTLDELREEMRLAAASIRQWMPETLPASDDGKIHFARLLAESAAESIEQFLATTGGA
ncbi:hypothetical protein GGQ73_000595 [Rhizobium skierniewicense]|uniref:Uncharacterized protein n=1 Tax=Rhizobium skierniewicense TaxID=984260 RepID=A0A7W6CA46_9HYPH|nr:hypothetical protein [Rhizobium skierniewicense]MBB3944670.1 hypothetical protein [Rhizobium skierniewicense]